MLAGEKKVSGNACHVVGDSVVVHGTLLLHSNLDNVTAALTPPADKLRRHAVASVRQRVTNLADLGVTDIEKIKACIVKRFSSLSHPLTSTDITYIDTIEQSYLSPEFITGKRQ